MNKEVIRIDKTRIDQALTACEDVCKLAQRLHTQLKELDCEPGTMQELNNILSSYDLENLLKDKIIEKKGTDKQLNISGLTLDKIKFREFFTIPNIQDIKRTIINMLDITGYQDALKRIELTDGVFSIVSTCKWDITELYTHYAYGDNQIETLKKLTALKNAFNDWLAFRNVTDNQTLDHIEGLRFADTPGRYELDEAYITSM